MNIESYRRAQKEHFETVQRLEHFSVLVPLVHQVYLRSISLIPMDSPATFGRLLLLCNKQFLSAATLVGQGQPDDAASVTRRAIEAARVAFAFKWNKRNEKLWLACEQRSQRWRDRQSGKKPPRRPFPRLDLPKDHPIVNDLETQWGILSDAYVHFTPEYFSTQNWRDTEEEIRLLYFVSDERTIRRELILLTGTHANILRLFDECFDGVFSADVDWQRLMTELHDWGRRLAGEFRAEQPNSS